MLLSLCGWLTVTSEAAPWVGRTEVTSTRDAGAGITRFEAEPIRTTGGGYRYRLVAVKKDGGELSVDLVLETFARSAKPVAPWSTVRDLTSRDQLPVLRTETSAAGVQLTTIGLPGDYLTRMLESQERNRWVLEGLAVRDELEIPKRYIRALLRSARGPAESD